MDFTADFQEALQHFARMLVQGRDVAHAVLHAVGAGDEQVRAPLLVILSLAVAVGVGLLPLSISRWVRRARTSATAGQPTTERAAS